MASAFLLVLLMIASAVPAASFAAAPGDARIAGVPTPEPQYSSVTDLVARRTSTPLTVDGVVDAKWADALPFKAFVTGASGSINVYLRAFFDDDSVYIMAQWDEPTIVRPPPGQNEPPASDYFREPWELLSNATPGTWERKAWGEDRFSFMWADPDAPVANFTKQGCDGVCHNQLEMFTDYPSEMLDTWVWSAATSDRKGYADDGYLSTNGSVVMDPTRVHVTRAAIGWDPGNDGWLVNVDPTDLKRPAYVYKDGITPQNSSFMLESEAQQVDWSSFDVSSLPAGAFEPGHVIKAPSGDRADISAKGSHNDTGWTLELKRARDTGSVKDVPFTEANTPYYFSIAVTNNLTGENHSKAPNTYTLWLAEPELPDLTVKTIAYADPNTINSNVTLHVFAENIGWVDAPASRVALYWDAEATPRMYLDVPALGWGQTFSPPPGDLSTAGLTAGPHTIRAVADADGVVTEISETNNERTKSITLLAELLPDLTITALAIAPDPAPRGNPATITLTVKNVGSKGATGVYIIAYIDDPEHPLAFTTKDLPKGATDPAVVMLLSSVSLPIGNYTLNATVDPNDDIRESDETNNTFSVAFEVVAPSRPDLVVLDLTPASGTVRQGDTTTAAITVKNIGNAAARIGLEVALYLDAPFTQGTAGQVGTCATTVALAPGGVWDALITWTVPIDADLGPHELRAHVNWDGAILELDATNNNLTYDQLRVARRAMPDLAVLSIDPAAPEGKLETAVNITVRVGNAGGSPSQPTTLDVVDATHNRTLSTIFVPGIAPGSTAVVYFEWAVSGVQPGVIQLQFIADPSDSISEENELNNTLTEAFTVHPADLPDLAIMSVTFTPAAPRVGDGVTITVSVRNNGTKASVATQVTLRLGNNLIGQKDLGVLAPGASSDIEVAWAATEILTPMRYPIKVVVDPSNDNRDPDRDNNEWTAGVTFSKAPAPDLRNATITPSKQRVKDGTEVTFTVSVLNVGDAPGTVRISIKDGSTEVASKTGVIVPTGGNKTEPFTLTLKGAGDHAFTVVIKPAAGTELSASTTVKVDKKTNGGPGFAAVATLVALAAVAAIAVVALRRRK
jgi:subtilase family serine protease